MNIHWGSLLAVFVVSAGLGGRGRGPGQTLGLAGLAGLSAPATPAAPAVAADTAEIGVSARRWVLPAPSWRATLALLSLTAATAIVLLGLSVIPRQVTTPTGPTQPRCAPSRRAGRSEQQSSVALGRVRLTK